MTTMTPDGSIEGATLNRADVRKPATPPAPPRDERPGVVTIVWRDGEVLRLTPWGSIRGLPRIDPLPEQPSPHAVPHADLNPSYRESAA